MISEFQIHLDSIRKFGWLQIGFKFSIIDQWYTQLISYKNAGGIDRWCDGRMEWHLQNAQKMLFEHKQTHRLIIYWQLLFPIHSYFNSRKCYSVVRNNYDRDLNWNSK